MNLKDCKVDAIALYGSQLRPDFDHLSDRDLLLVGNDIKGLATAKERFEMDGFSCGVYPWNRLWSMAENGALFIQHLKQESVILKDKDEKLKNLFLSFRPRVDYSVDIEQTKNIVALTEYISESHIVAGWVLDVLAVAVRNMAILRLANTGKYVFGYSELLEKLAEIGGISNENCWRLRHLRKWKQLYRNRRYELMPRFKIIQAYQKIVGDSFSIDFDSKIIGLEKMKDELVSRSYKMVDRYCRFRLLEGAIGIQLQQNLGSDPSFKNRFNHIVTNQNHYGLFCTDLSRPLRKISDQIKKHQQGQPLAQAAGLPAAA